VATPTSGVLEVQSINSLLRNSILAKTSLQKVVDAEEVLMRIEFDGEESEEGVGTVIVDESPDAILKRVMVSGDMPGEGAQKKEENIFTADSKLISEFIAAEKERKESHSPKFRNPSSGEPLRCIYVRTPEKPQVRRTEQ